MASELGNCLKKKNMKSAEFINKWVEKQKAEVKELKKQGGGDDGHIVIGQFAQSDFANFVNSLGLNAFRTDLDALFDSIDDDGSGR